MRVSDDDRQRAVEELRRHCAAGRIDVDEYAARIERALSATTLEELDAIRSDLPMMRIAEPGGHGIWAGGSTRASPPRRALGVAGSAAGAGDDLPRSWDRLGAMVVAVITVLVVLTAILVSLVAEWTWAVLLLAGWAAGVLQGRVGRNGRSNR
jgi:hypothetical protein